MAAQFDHNCFGKTSYASHADALRCIRFRLKGHRARSKNGRGCMAPYRCPNCHHWHIGSSALREPKRKH